MKSAIKLAPDRGRFIVIEGIDGSGSSTQCALLLQHLRKAGVSVILTKEPTDGPAGAMLRLALAHRLTGPRSGPESQSGPASAQLDPRTMALLFAADRLDHTTGLIEPKLSAGITVICDRYVLSSLVYQGLQVDRDWIVEINRHIPVPDITIYLRSSVKHTQARMNKRGQKQELFEAPKTQEDVEASYQHVIKTGYGITGPIHVVRAAEDAGEVARRIRKAVVPLFPSLQKPTGAFHLGPTLFESGG